MKIINIATFDGFEQLYQKYEQTINSDEELRSLMLLFVASDEPETNESWCSDCRMSKHNIEKAIDDFRYNDELVLAVIQVGQRDEWKRADNPFRMHKLKISAVPTLLSLKLVSISFVLKFFITSFITAKTLTLSLKKIDFIQGTRLVEAECADAAKVSHLFSNSI